MSFKYIHINIIVHTLVQYIFYNFGQLNILLNIQKDTLKVITDFFSFIFNHFIISNIVT